MANSKVTQRVISATLALLCLVHCGSWVVAAKVTLVATALMSLPLFLSFALAIRGSWKSLASLRTAKQAPSISVMIRALPWPWRLVFPVFWLLYLPLLSLGLIYSLRGGAGAGGMSIWAPGLPQAVSVAPLALQTFLYLAIFHVVPALVDSDPEGAGSKR